MNWLQCIKAVEVNPSPFQLYEFEIKTDLDMRMSQLSPKIIDGTGNVLSKEMG